MSKTLEIMKRRWEFHECRAFIYLRRCQLQSHTCAQSQWTEWSKETEVVNFDDISVASKQDRFQTTAQTIKNTKNTSFFFYQITTSIRILQCSHMCQCEAIFLLLWRLKSWCIDSSREPQLCISSHKLLPCKHSAKCSHMNLQTSAQKQAYETHYSWRACFSNDESANTFLPTYFCQKIIVPCRTPYST